MLKLIILIFKYNIVFNKFYMIDKKIHHLIFNQILM